MNKDVMFNCGPLRLFGLGQRSGRRRPSTGMFGLVRQHKRPTGMGRPERLADGTMALPVPLGVASALRSRG